MKNTWKRRVGGEVNRGSAYRSDSATWGNSDKACGLSGEYMYWSVFQICVCGWAAVHM